MSTLLGVDVGFSERSKTTGLAWRIGAQIETCLAGSSWDARRSLLPRDTQFSLAALDAPVLAVDAPNSARSCEAVFYRGPFWNRCRPGLSHHGRGLALRIAGSDAASQFKSVLASGRTAYGPEVLPGVPIIEAFPNTFLGVLVPETLYFTNIKDKKQPRSDWLYERAVECGALARVLRHLGWNDHGTVVQVETESNHDRRAALICLLTAGFAHAGNATIIGDPIGGWFWLPPKALWEPWALQGLEEALSRSSLWGFAAVPTWSSGISGS